MKKLKRNREWLESSRGICTSCQNPG